MSSVTPPLQLEAPSSYYDQLEVECGLGGTILNPAYFQIELARATSTKMSEDSSTSTDSATAGLGSSK
jgi:hypothetical protein